MENVDRDYEVLETGIKQLLGKEEYAKAERSPEPCVHISDGFVYNKDAPNVSVVALLQCVKCNIQYEILVATGQVIG